MEKKATDYLNDIAKDVHNQHKNWWIDLDTGLQKDRNTGELLMLVVSEVAEAMEGDRKGLMDDHLPHRSMFEVELADTLIRIFDLAGAKNLDLSGAVHEKLQYNKNRADHKIENRKAQGGKKY
jgi:NTP pyrophosphatase (non-canonical NTP hydrolase)